MRFSRPSRRLLAIIAAGAIAAGLLAAWATASPRSHESSASFHNGFVTFRYPASWSATVWKGRILHFNPMVYVSTETSQHDPCRTTGLETVCGWPVSRLARSGVIVRWENRGFPGVDLAKFPGTTTSVGGRAARIAVQRPGICRSVGADETISVAISRPLESNWTQVDACLRGPNLSALEKQVHALLGTAHFTAP